MKELGGLAIFGGHPTFQEKIVVGYPNIVNRERLWERINDILDRRWLTNNGPQVQELEKRICEILGVKYCIATCNATTGLQIAIRAAELTGEVIVPSFTFIATAHALAWLGIKPIFCDIDPRTHTINPHQVEKLITPRTTGIIGVHIWGRPCQVQLLQNIARQRNLKLLFDGAHAFGCSHNGRMIGNFGDAEIFSFHATKFFNTFEGGAVVTNDDELADTIRFMREYGFINNGFSTSVGTNGKMSEILAATGLCLLDDIDLLIATSYRNYQHYQHGLEKTPGIHLITYDAKEKNNYQYVVLEIDEAVTLVSRDHLLDVLHSENILAKRYFYPGCHQMEPYRSYCQNPDPELSETEKLVKRILVLPTGTAVGKEEINKICSIIRMVVKFGKEVKARLESEIPIDKSLRVPEILNPQSCGGCSNP